ncbi:hypothetical protein [Nonomuraea recticatena]|uniref:Uncharacterized protein n=1 Tax=Nonomuraea recticatena TaxID=46178 RepID=A0ABN3RPN7_9ACTN
MQDVERLADRIAELVASEPVEEMSDQQVEEAARVFASEDGPEPAYPAVA